MHSESLVDKKKKNPGNIDSTKISSIEKKNVKVSTFLVIEYLIS